MRSFLVVLAILVHSSMTLANSSLIVNIDNPSFRKLVIAIPDFDLSGKLSKEGASELKRLLNFSGFFNIISNDAFDKHYNAMTKSLRKKQGPRWLSKLTKLSGSELVQWRTMGVDALILTSKTPDSEEIFFKILDVSRNQEISSQIYTLEENIIPPTRQFADRILEAYTGKSGIFASRIALVGRKAKGSAKQIFICDFDGTNLQQITSEQSPHLSPAWSPDGTKLAYTSFESGTPHIYIYDTKTKKKIRLTNHTGLNSGANWSPDGRYIAYTASNGGDTDIYYMPSQGGPRKLLIRGSGLDVDPKFSPDGQYLAFVSGRYGNPHIFVGQLTSGSKPKVISDKRLTYAGWYNSTPAWSPESNKIIFGGYDKDIDRYDIFIMNPNGSQLERLTLKTGDNESPTWSPNGQLIVFQSNRIGSSNIKGRPSLYLMNRDGSDQRKIKMPLYEAQTPAWSNQVK